MKHRRWCSWFRVTGREAGPSNPTTTTTPTPPMLRWLHHIDAPALFFHRMEGGERAMHNEWLTDQLNGAHEGSVSGPTHVPPPTEKFDMTSGCARPFPQQQQPLERPKRAPACPLVAQSATLHNYCYGLWWNAVTSASVAPLSTPHPPMAPWRRMTKPCPYLGRCDGGNEQLVESSIVLPGQMQRGEEHERAAMASNLALHMPPSGFRVYPKLSQICVCVCVLSKTWVIWDGYLGLNINMYELWIRSGSVFSSLQIQICSIWF